MKLARILYNKIPNVSIISKLSIENSSVPTMTSSPVKLVCPVSSPVSIPENIDLVYFDLETTGFSRTSDITQIGATCSDGSTFSCYSLPEQPIHPSASEVTGLTVKDGRLFLKDKLLHTVSIHTCLNEFIQYLETKKKPLCVGHNIRSFDCPILIYHLLSCDYYTRFEDCITGFVDTTKLFKDFYPNEGSYSIVSLMQSLFELQFDAHNALDDAQATKLILDYSQMPVKSFGKYSFSAAFIKESIEYKFKKSTNVASYWHMVQTNAISNYIATRLGNHGVHKKFLCNLYQECGEESVRKLISEEVNGRPRITKDTRIVESIVNYLQSYSDE